MRENKMKKIYHRTDSICVRIEIVQDDFETLIYDEFSRLRYGVVVLVLRESLDEISHHL
jgi:hypothetical protein